MSAAFRGAAVLQETVAQWADPLVDAQQTGWSSSTGSSIAARPAGGVAVLGSWGNTMRNAVRNKER